MSDPQERLTFACEICGKTKPDGNLYYYQFPDAGKDGQDLDGFCCKECGKNPMEAAYKHWFKRSV